MARVRARDLGVAIGRLTPGARNAITDVAGVRVGHTTLVRDPGGTLDHAVRTGVTAIFPHDGIPWRERVYVGTHVLNGYGELIGINQLNEWGILHSPIVLTSSLAIGRAYDATAQWMARHPTDGVGDMPVVTECDDSFLNDAISFPLRDEDVWNALDSAEDGDVGEGNVGAGTGMQCFDFKGGIGTASRVLAGDVGGHTVGTLVLTNFGLREQLLVDGVPVGAEIDDLMPEEHSDGSCIVVVATDAPMLPHQLRRLAVRAGLGLARTGSVATNGSGELMIAFSTAQRIGSDASEQATDVRALVDGPSDEMPNVFSALFAATVDSVEESVVNALVAAETMTGHGGNTLHALPVDRMLGLLERAGRLDRRRA